MPRMKVKSSYFWNGKETQPGDEHEATDKESETLLALQWAERLPTLGEKVNAALTATAEAISTRTGRPKRQYRRRDMRASA